jgi:hypothetical protein
MALSVTSLRNNNVAIGVTTDIDRHGIPAQLRAGKGITKVAREIGVGTGTVQRIRDWMKSPFDAAA